MPNRTRTLASLASLALLTGCTGPGGLSFGSSAGGVTLDVWWDPATGEAIAAPAGREPPGVIPLLVVPQPQASPGVFGPAGVVPAEPPSPLSPAPGVICGVDRTRNRL